MSKEDKEISHLIMHKFIIKPKNNLLTFTYTQLLLYGVHIGHSFKNTHFYALWLVFMHRQNLLILNLFKTIVIMRSGLRCINQSCSSFHPIWFVNLDLASGIIVRQFAKYCGEFSCTTNWIYGFISNYQSIFNIYYKLKKMAYFAWNGHNKNNKKLFRSWFYSRNSWPRTVFVSSVRNSYQPTKEAFQLGVPCLGVVDNDTYTHVASLPMPGNDDSSECIIFYNEFISKYILLRKFINITNWYFHVRQMPRLQSFKNWIQKQLKLNIKLPSIESKKYYLNFLIKFKFSLLKNLNLGMRTFFAQYYIYSRQGYQEKMIPLGMGLHNSFLPYEEDDQRILKLKKEFIKEKKEEIKKRITLLKKKIQPDYHFFLEKKNEWKKISSIGLIKNKWYQSFYVYRRYVQLNYFKKKLIHREYYKKYIKKDRFYKTHMNRKKIRYFFAKQYLKYFFLYNYMRFFNLSSLSNNNHKNNLFDKLFFSVGTWHISQSLPLKIKLIKKYNKISSDIKPFRENYFQKLSKNKIFNTQLYILYNILKPKYFKMLHSWQRKKNKFIEEYEENKYNLDLETWKDWHYNRIFNFLTKHNNKKENIFIKLFFIAKSYMKFYKYFKNIYKISYTYKYFISFMFFYFLYKIKKFKTFKSVNYIKKLKIFLIFLYNLKKKKNFNLLNENTHNYYNKCNNNIALLLKWKKKQYQYNLTNIFNDNNLIKKMYHITQTKYITYNDFKIKNTNFITNLKLKPILPRKKKKKLSFKKYSIYFYLNKKYMLNDKNFWGFKKDYYLFPNWIQKITYTQLKKKWRNWKKMEKKTYPKLIFPQRCFFRKKI